MSSIQNSNKGLIKVLIAIFLVGSSSCQKVIKMDINAADQQLVVEANISDQPGFYIVKLSKTVNFDDITVIPIVTKAFVAISDSFGNNDTLKELGNGIYRTTKLIGMPGRTYEINIVTENRACQAKSYMPYPVEIKSLKIGIEKSDRPSFGGRDGGQRVNYQVVYEIADPVDYTNYYRFVVYHNNIELRSRRVFNDQFHNGKIIQDEFGLIDTAKFEPGDTVLVKLLSIDKATYDFYRTLRDGFGGLGFLSASPSNPITNISNNGLGYFSAHSEKSQVLIVPK